MEKECFSLSLNFLVPTFVSTFKRVTGGGGYFGKANYNPDFFYYDEKA